MKPPERLQSLIEEGLIDTVVRQLMSGKEAMVYVVRCGDETRCAKVYKDATQRSFRQAVDYTENRKVKNSRQARAMAKGTRFGREATEAAWQNAEVDALYRLAAAGVRVPTPYNFHDGVLLMELVTDEHGDAAPRLNDVVFTKEDARIHHASLLVEVVRMLCAGVVHGDLSEFNILLGTTEGTRLSDGAAEQPSAGHSAEPADGGRGLAGAGDAAFPADTINTPQVVANPLRVGPVIIDLPQAIDAAGNNHAHRMLLRDVENLRNFFGRFAPELLGTRFGDEIWELYQRGLLSPETKLTGQFAQKTGPVDVHGVLREVDDARAEDAARRLRMGL